MLLEIHVLYLVVFNFIVVDCRCCFAGHLCLCFIFFFLVTKIKIVEPTEGHPVALDCHARDEEKQGAACDRPELWTAQNVPR